MSDLFLLSEAQMRRIEPYFPLSHGIARVDDRMVISGIIFVIKNGLRLRDAPREYGPHKTINDRRNPPESSSYRSKPSKKGLFPAVLGGPKGD